MRYTPERGSFSTRYACYDLPGDVAARLEALFFVKDPADLALKRQQAAEWFHAALASLE